MLVVLAFEIFSFPKRNDSLLFLREYAINRIRVSCCPGPFRKLQYKDFVNPILDIENTNVKWVRIRVLVLCEFVNCEPFIHLIDV
jgi:hypothetical protein